MALNTRVAAALVGGVTLTGALLGAGAAGANPLDSQTHTRHAYGPYTEQQCHNVLTYHPAIQAAYKANPGAGSPGACISRGGGAFYLYTNVTLR
ncbi:hypothetical protein FOV72_19680 [Gordonia rubripertincta]|uniref:hypothetical protein n=1 Tax=Gordonia rubripertincta TaxID=36822 RepID=UPI00117C262A|nr:hypothetical protein [Gordonia rubripertincta]TSD93483.1 hypothetical protein FOV72_19680 [Gordonia rubripertincta]